jgi:hypothetical protein
MRALIPVVAAGFCLVGLSACVDYATYRASSSPPAPTTTTTTTVVRDANGNPLSTTEAVRDANGNPVNYAPGYSAPTYRRY